MVNLGTLEFDFYFAINLELKNSVFNAFVKNAEIVNINFRKSDK